MSAPITVFIGLPRGYAKSFGGDTLRNVIGRFEAQSLRDATCDGEREELTGFWKVTRAKLNQPIPADMIKNIPEYVEQFRNETYAGLAAILSKFHELEVPADQNGPDGAGNGEDGAKEGN